MNSDEMSRRRANRGSSEEQEQMIKSKPSETESGMWPRRSNKDGILPFRTIRNISFVMFVLLALGVFVSEKVYLVNASANASSVTSWNVNEGLVPEARAALHMFLDKPVYRQGDTVYMRTNMLDAVQNRPYPFCMFSPRVIRNLEFDKKPGLKGSSVDEAEKWNPFHTNSKSMWYQYELHSGDFVVELEDPIGSREKLQKSVYFENCVLSMTYEIPPSKPGGVYTLRVGPRGYDQLETLKHVNPAWTTRQFEIRTTTKTNPKLRIDSEFEKKGYYPGETVSISVRSILRSNGEQASNATLVTTVLADNRQVLSKSQYCESYPCPVVFKLDLQEGEENVRVNIVVMDGAVVESTSKAIPVISDELEIEVFPESGVLVPGLQSRLYIQARNKKTKKPLGVSGDIVSLGYVDGDVNSRVVASFETIHEGRGITSFFLVEASSNYSVQIGSHTISHFPIKKELFDKYDEVSSDSHSKYLGRGAVLTIVKPVVPFEEEIVVQAQITASESMRSSLLDKMVHLGGDKTFDIGLFKKDFEITRLNGVSLSRNADGTIPDENEYTLSYPVNCNVSGVLRVTLFEHDTQRPLAERLVFRKPQSVLEVGIKRVSLENSQVAETQARGPIVTIPSRTVGLQVTTWKRDFKSGKREPVEALVSLSVVDDALPSTVDKRDRHPSLPASVLLEHEVDELFSSSEYLPQFEIDLDKPETQTEYDSTKSSSDAKIDLLLGTQGWRRFIFYSDPSQPESEKEISSGVEDDSSEIEKRERVFGYHPIKILEYDTDRPHVMPVMARNFPVMFMQNRDVERMDEAPPIMAMAEGVANFAEDADVDDDQANEELNIDMDFMPNMINRAQKRIHIYQIDRVYAHKNENSKNNAKSERVDFKETVYWNPALETSIGKEDSGEAKSTTILFDLSDSATTFSIQANGFTRDGDVGSALRSIVAEPALEIDTIVPQAYVVGDEPMFPVMLREGNQSSSSSSHVALVTLELGNQSSMSLAGLEVKRDNPYPYEKQLQVLDSNDVLERESSFATMLNMYEGKNSIRFYVNAKAIEQSQQGRISLSGAMLMRAPSDNTVSNAVAESYYTDTVERSFVVLPEGFPQSVPLGGMLSVSTPVGSKTVGTKANSSTFTQGVISKDTVLIPDNVKSWIVKTSDSMINGTIEFDLRVHMRSTSSLIDAVERLIREPCGCFEQTSSTTYPLILVLEYLRSRKDGTDQRKLAKMINDSIEKLKVGYQRLVSYESKGGGFEWFGGSPAHETLTAYGLIQFAKMRIHIPNLVDEAMLVRTQRWLMSRRDGEGDFLRNPKALDSFGRADTLTNNAYILWSLAKCDMLSWEDKYLIREIDALLEQSETSHYSNPYIVALGASMLVDLLSNVRNPEESLPDFDRYRLQLIALTDGLAKLQTEEGSFKDVSYQTITSSGGVSKEVEAVALSAIAWLNVRQYAEKYDLDANSHLENAAKAMEFITSKANGMYFGSTQATALALEAIVLYEDVMLQGIPQTAEAVLMIDGEIVERRKLKPSTIEEPSNPVTETVQSHCVGGQVWNQCGSQCTPSCQTPHPICVMMCVARCECPREKPLWDAGSNRCLQASECKTIKKENPDVIRFDSKLVLSKGNLSTPGRVSNITLVLLSGTEEKQNSTSDPKLRISGEINYQTIKPDTCTDCPLRMSTKLAKDTMHEAESSSLLVDVSNSDEETGLHMVVAVVGIPAGLEVDTESLKSLKAAEEVSYWETSPGFVTLYWRGLGPGETKSVSIDTKAVVPGRFNGKASVVYQYYHAEDKTWIDGMQLHVTPYM